MLGPKRSKNSQTLGRILVISVFFYFLTLFATNIVFAQDCQYISGEQGDRYIKIDGEIYFYLPLDKSRKLQADIQELHLVKNENNLLEQKLELKDKIIDSKEETVKVVRDELKFQRGFNEEYVEKKREQAKTHFWETSEFGFGVGAVVGGGVVLLVSSVLSGS